VLALPEVPVGEVPAQTVPEAVSLPEVEAVPPAPASPEVIVGAAGAPEEIASAVVSGAEVPVTEEERERHTVEALKELAEQAAGRGETPQAIEFYAQTAAAYHADGNVSDELAALESLAALSLKQQDFENVLAYVDRGLTLAQEADNPQREGQLLVLLGDMQVALGKDSGAETAYQEAINAFRPIEAWSDIGLTLDKLGELYLDQSRLQDAVTVWEQALPIFERVNQPDQLKDVLSKLGSAHAGLLQWDKAMDCGTRGLELAEASGDEHRVFEQLNQLGAVLEASGNPQVALACHQRALHIAFRQADRDAELGEAMLTVGRLMMDDTAQLNRVVQLLEAASEKLPDNTEVQRLLSRARARRERLSQAGVALLPAEDSLEDYVRSVIEQPPEATP
jgi:tetratricopeptide (TPR) repeat protein